MKKMILLLAIILIAFFIAISFITNTQRLQQLKGNPYGKKNLHPATLKQLNDRNYQNLILPDRLAQDLKDKENKTVYFYIPDCRSCKETTPVVAPLAEKMGIDLVQFNLLEFKEGANHYKIKKVPTIIHFKNGTENARITGYNDEETFKKWFIRHKVN